MAENTTVREDHSNSEEDWDENIEQQTTEQQQTSQEHTTHQQVQTTLNDDDDESEEYDLTAAGGAIRKTQTNVQVDRTTDGAKIQAEDGIRDAQESRGLGDVYKRQIFSSQSPLEFELSSLTVVFSAMMSSCRIYTGHQFCKG